MYSMRRTDRRITAEETEKILKKGLYGTLASVSEDNSAYAVPLFYVYENGAVYFHCAGEGHKLKNIAYNDRVCFNVVSDVEVIPNEFAAYYSSADVFGRAQIVEGDEKKHALVALIEKYSNDFYDDGMKYIDKLYDVTTVCKITAECVTGKARKKQ